ncbi:ABC transporter substrate-binding protein [Pseudorhodoferax aquiterrae]|uniref:ABC transporter substrate-binding protein n=1 Tax=Pseudorhodoferax aquiterrae TaxID=747304 RepID=A0ABQ3FZG8_9BURK|nr:ABC transporter substrate-binding protein [Pseudorhodoferax aquiterrae]
MNKETRRTALACLAACALGATLGTAQAADPSWPTRPVRLLVGFPGGSTPDMAARALADPLGRVLGQPVIVENKPGASGNIAADQVAKATDDHTLGVVINGNLTSAKLLNPKLSYDPQKDFAEISLLATAPLVLVAAPQLPDGAAFFAAMRQAGAKANYGSVGAGSVAHLGMELLKSRSGIAPVHVPYSGNPAVVTAIIGEQVQMALVPPGVAMPQVQAGKLKAIGVTSGRSALVPSVAPLADAGVKDFNLEVWTALVGPAGLSKAAQARLAAEVPRILREPETRTRLLNQGWQAVGTSSEGLHQRVKEEAALLGAIIRAQNISVD